MHNFAAPSVERKNRLSTLPAEYVAKGIKYYVRANWEYFHMCGSLRSSLLHFFLLWTIVVVVDAVGVVLVKRSPLVCDCVSTPVFQCD